MIPIPIISGINPLQFPKRPVSVYQILSGFKPQPLPKVVSGFIAGKDHQRRFVDALPLHRRKNCIHQRAADTLFSLRSFDCGVINISSPSVMSAQNNAGNTISFSYRFMIFFPLFKEKRYMTYMKAAVARDMTT